MCRGSLEPQQQWRKRRDAADSVVSASPPPAAQLSGALLLLPEVDETVGGLGDGRERPDGGVADPQDASLVLLLLHVIVEQIDDVPGVTTHRRVSLCVCVCVGGLHLSVCWVLVRRAHPGWSLDPLGLASVNTHAVFRKQDLTPVNLRRDSPESPRSVLSSADSRLSFWEEREAVVQWEPTPGPGPEGLRPTLASLCWMQSSVCAP